MLHARRDYDAIQDPRGLIPDMEPVMLLRGQDKHAPKALMYYVLQLLKDEEVEYDLIEAVILQIRSMQQWQREVKSKTPDLPQFELKFD